MKPFAMCAYGLLAAALAPPTLAQDNEAEKLFRAMEKKIKEAKAFQITATIELKGETKDRGGRLKGFLLLTNDNKAHLKISGSISGEAVKRELVSDGKQIKMKLGLKEQETKPTPNKLHGLLSTLVIYTGVEPSAEGLALAGLDEFQKGFDAGTLRFGVTDFKAGAAEKVGERDAKVVSYTMGDKGDKTAPAVTLLIDAKTLLPLKRVVVTKSEGTFTEIYDEFTLDPKIDGKAFELPK
jgi:hypothetical protein